MSNIYSPPTANLDDEPGASESNDNFYVVAPLKFWLLFVLTLGFYQVYWFYKNWSRYKARTHDDIWPVMRGIFTIFFTHSLFREIDAALVAEEREHSWDPGLLATGYVIATIVNRILDRTPDSMDKVVLPIELFIMLPLVGYLLYRAQVAINIACGDPTGASNAKLTWANYLWMILGAALIVLGLIGTFVDLKQS
ncbi:MAG: hypothetical protein JO002_13415 [Burkholderiaceae bacterium]|nr:hypothetical protein [Burkholderiaceae bacterium]